jgi:hypothetical protein
MVPLFVVSLLKRSPLPWRLLCSFGIPCLPSGGLLLFLDSNGFPILDRQLDGRLTLLPMLLCCFGVTCSSVGGTLLPLQGERFSLLSALFGGRFAPLRALL